MLEQMQPPAEMGLTSENERQREIMEELDALYTITSKFETKFPLDGEVEYRTFKREGKTFHIISGEHYSRKAIDLIKEKVAPRASKNPKNWVFLIEGLGTFGDTDCAEVIYAYEVAETLKIAKENPIVDPYRQEIIEWVAKYGVTEQMVHIALVADLMRAVPDEKLVTEKLAEVWSEDPDYIRGVAYAGALIESNPSRFAEKKKEMEQALNLSLKESNAVSKVKLRECLGTYASKKEVFIMLGSGHQEILGCL